MGKYLISTVETYRVESEAEATALIASAKASSWYTLSKYTSEKKEVKSKGAVIEEYWKVALTKVFNDIKAPEDEINVKYAMEGAFNNESSEG